MKRGLPPLNALIAAEVAARLTSFKSASEELHVTPSAVSHQIRGLEDWLGFSLFDRGTRSVRLTDAGVRYIGAVSNFLDSLEAATREEIERSGRRQILRVQTTDSLASRWLVARLPDFQSFNPDISVQILTFEYTEGFRSSEVDVAILYGRGDWSNCVSRLLLRETIFPVCNPKLLSRRKDSSDNGVFSHPLIHDINLGTTWLTWCQLAEHELELTEPLDLTSGLRFNHSHLALKAAELGSGVALASRPLVLDSLRNKDLVAPFDTELPTGFGYHVIHAMDTDAHKRCKRFVDWLIQQVDPD